MKKSELKKSIKEEIIDILEVEDTIKDLQNKKAARAEYNAELAKTAKLSKDAGLTENVNPEVQRLINGFIRKMADRYDYSLQDAVNTIMQVLRSQKYDGVDEGNDSDKSQDDGYVNHTYNDDVVDKYNIPVTQTAMFEEEDEDTEPTKSQLKNEPISKIGYKLADTQKEMKQVVKKWKDAEGTEKEKLKDRLRELTKIKKELESLLENKK